MDTKSNDLRGVPTIADAIGLEVLEVNGEQVMGRPQSIIGRTSPMACCTVGPAWSWPRR